MALVLDLDLASREFSLDPYPTYAALRESAPVHHYEPWDMWLVSRYDDVLGLLRDADAFPSVDRVGRFAHGRTIVQMNGREHAFQRRILTPYFRPGQVEKLRLRIEEVSRELIDGFRADGHADLVGRYTNLFALRIIAELLGLPFTEQFHHWAAAIIAFNSNYAGDPEIRAAGERAGGDFRDYVRPVLEERRRNPADDLLSYLTVAEADGEQLDDEAILTFASLTITAGSETTNHTIGNLFLELLADEKQLHQVRDVPGLAVGAFLETMRHSPAIHSVLRTTAADVELAGTTIPAGGTVIALIASGNRDQRRFADPDRFDVTRAEARDHLGFGYARHRCLGSFLAQAEVATAVRHLAELPNLRFAAGELPYSEGSRHRGPTTLPVEFG
jgi:cytochrome P450